MKRALHSSGTLRGSRLLWIVNKQGQANGVSFTTNRRHTRKQASAFGKDKICNRKLPQGPQTLHYFMHNDWLLLLKMEYLNNVAYHISHHTGEFVPVRCICH
jgi:hypothetical protein